MHYMRYVKEDDDWAVGYFEPTDDGGEDWHALVTFDNEHDAARYVNYLNGGAGAKFAWEEIK